jgi:hypothetical protein
MASPRGKDKEQLGDPNESNEQLKDIQENKAKMISMLTSPKLTATICC